MLAIFDRLGYSLPSWALWTAGFIFLVMFVFGCCLFIIDAIKWVRNNQHITKRTVMLSVISVVLIAAFFFAFYLFKPLQPTKADKRDVIMVGDKAVHEIKIGNVTIKTQEDNPCADDKPLTILKLFECDFVDIGHTNVTFAYKLENTGIPITIKAKQFTMYDQNSKFLSFYISRPTTVYEVASFIAHNYEHFLNEIEKHNGIVAVKQPGDSDRINTMDLVNSKRVFVYHEDDLSSEQIYTLKKTYEDSGLSLILRGRDYLNAQVVEENRKKNHVTR